MNAEAQPSWVDRHAGVLITLGLIVMLGLGLAVQKQPTSYAREQAARSAPHKLTPPPVVTRVAKGWQVSGCEDASYRGLYTRKDKHNGQPAYTNGQRWLWDRTGQGAWALSRRPKCSMADTAHMIVSPGPLPGQWIPRQVREGNDLRTLDQDAQDGRRHSRVHAGRNEPGRLPQSG